MTLGSMTPLIKMTANNLPQIQFSINHAYNDNFQIFSTKIQSKTSFFNLLKNSHELK